MDSDLTKTFLESLKIKLNERRNLHLVSLLKFLHNSDLFYLKKSDFFTRNCSKSSLINYTEEIYYRLFPTPGSRDQSVQTEINESDISFELQLEKAIKAVKVNEKYIVLQPKKCN